MRDADAASNATLPIDEARLLARLQRWPSAAEVALLHREVAALQAELAQGAASWAAEQAAPEGLTIAEVQLELAQIAAARTLERAIYYVERLMKALSEVRTSALNDLNLNRWKSYADLNTDSLWIVDRRDSSGVHSARYWGNFIPQIPNQMMRRYTKAGDWVLDTFAGSGTSLIEGQRLGRHTLGIELQAALVAQTKALIAAEPNPHGVTIDLIAGDSAALDYQALIAGYGRASVQLVIMHPPYHDIIKFSDDPRDLSNAPSVDGFLQGIAAVAKRAATVLDRGRYLVLVIGDTYHQGDWLPLGFWAMNAVLAQGFALKSIVVKNFEETSGKREQKELWRYRALAGGFFVFKHEYIFVLRKV